MKARGFIPVVCATLSGAPPLDDAHGPLLQAYPDALRWYNVEQLPAWCGATKVMQRGSWTVFRLREGQSLHLPVAAEGWLRVVPISRGARSRVAVSLTDGSGLSCRMVDLGAPDDRDALFGPGQENPALFRVACPRDHQGDLDIALFLSRTEPAGPLPTYFDRLELPGGTAKLLRQADLQAETWHAMEAQRPVDLQVSGPARVQVELRLKPGHELIRDGLRFAFTASLNGRPGPLESIRTAVDLQEPLIFEGRPARLGRLERRWIDVPTGLHHLTLTTDHAVLVRLHQEGSANYLVPGSNLPRPWIPGILPPEPQRATTRWEGIDTLARDVRFREPGLSALAQVDRWHREHPEDAALREARVRAAAEWTTFRSLVPGNLPPEPLRPAYAWLRAPVANPLPPSRKAGAPGDLEQSLASLPMGIFMPLSAEAVYRLAPREAPAELRLLVDVTTPQPGRSLKVQLGTLPPMEVRLDAPLQLPQAWRATTPADLGLALAAQDRSGRAQPLLQGSERTPHLPPLPVVEAGSVRIPLPPEIQSVRLWADPAPGAPPLLAALQIRTSTRPEAPVDGAGLSEADAIRQLLERSEGESQDARPWLPLRRWLRAQSEPFRARVGLDQVMRDALEGQPLADGPERIARSRKLDGEGNRLGAVAAWAQAFRGVRGSQRAEALTGLYHALRKAGEPFLAEQWARAALLHGDPSLQETALALLERQFREAGADASRLALLATVAEANPSPARLVPLAEALLEEGQAQLALLALSLMPPSKAPELWVRTGRLVRQESTLRAGLKACSDQEAKKLWEGILCLDEGREAKAAQAWAEAGPTGAPWRRAREEALALAPRLAQAPSDPAVHEAWDQWILHHPGPWSWRNEPWLVREAAGGGQLQNLALDQVQQVFRCDPGRPVRLQVIGPVRLRVEAHPRHAADHPGELEGCLEVRGTDWVRALPFTRNWPAPGLRIDGQEGALPGQRVPCELELPPGLHDLEISAGRSSAWIIPSAYRPEVPLGPLPQRSPEVLQALKAPSAPAPAAAHPFKALPGLYLAGETQFTYLGMETLKRQVLAPLPPPLPWPRGSRPASARPLGEAPETLRGAPEPDASRPREVAARMDALAAAALNATQEQQACLAQAEHLASRCPEALLHSSAMDLLRRGTVWTPVGTSGTGAGLRLLPSQGFQPSATTTRVRHALLAEPGDRILSAQDALVYTLQQPAAWTLTLEASPFTPTLAQPLPVTLLITLGDQVQRLILAPGEARRTIQVPVPPGRHALRLELEHPFEGQWLRISFPQGLGQGRLEQPPQSFEVARRDAPVRFQANGPLWVRADRWTPEGTEPEYRYFAPGPQAWTILPGPDAEEALVTFSYQEVIPDRPLPAGRPWSLAINPVPGGAHTPSMDPQPTRSLQDAFPLGGQEDGTHSVHLRPFRRVDPVGPSDQAATQRGWEVGYEHRFLDPDTDRQRLLKAWARSLDGSGMSMGLGGRQEIPVYLNPLRAFGSVDLVLQSGAGPGKDHALASALDLEGGLRLPLDLGRRTSHTPEVSVFWRTMGYEHVTAQTQRQLDLDLWSPFRDRNRWGLKVSESLRHHPWRDTLLTARASTLLTRPHSEGLTLAVTALQGGWRQRIGPLEAILEGGVARYGSGALATAPFTRSHVLIGVEGSFWTLRQNLLSLGAEVRLDADRRIWTGSFSIGWSFGNGRGLRDMGRGERAFPHADARILSQGPNNGWKELPR